MSGNSFRIGVVFPQTESGTDPVAIKDFAQTVEALGFNHILAYDHVIGANTASRPDWNMPYSHVSTFHEPLVLFSFLAGVTKTLGYTTGVIILPQRQTALFGKQAANLDNFCGGRLQVGVGIGWNEIEYEALGMPFTERGERLDDQILFLRRLWTEPTFSHTSKFHRLSDGGIKPLPLQQPIPILVGGVSQAALKRAARLGDGWLPVLPATAADEKIAELHEAVHAAGRDPAHVPLENIVFLGKTLGGPVRTAEDGAADAFAWKRAGAQAVCFHTMGMGFASLDEHMALLRQIADMLGLKQKG